MNGREGRAKKESFRATLGKSELKLNPSAQLLAAFVLLGLVFTSNYWFILNHYFHFGGSMLDTGWFAGLVYHNPALKQPPSIAGESYFAVHFSPILQLLSLLSYLIPMPLIFYYAVTQGLIYFVVALGGLAALWGLFSATRQWALIPLAFCFAYNGIVQASMSYPHFEPFYVGWALLFLACLFRGYSKSAIVFFLLALMVREDTGFHLFGFLFPLFLISWLEKDIARFRKRLALFSAVAFCYSTTALVIQKAFFSEGESTFKRIYIGDPPFSHLTSEFLSQRLHALTHDSLYVFLPWILLLATAIWLRSLSFSVGFVAVLPWVTLNGIALSNQAGELSSYYAYPIAVSLLWPSLWYLLKKRPEPVRTKLQALQALLLILSVGLYLCKTTFVLTQAFTIPDAGPADYRRIEKEVDAALTGEDIYFDASVAAFFPHKIPVDRMVHRGRDNSHVKSVMGFYNGIEMDLCQEVARQNELMFFQAFKGGRFYLLSSEATVLSRDDWFPAMKAESGLLSLWILKSTQKSRRDWATQVISTQAFSDFRLVCFAPNLPLQPGRYELIFTFRPAAGAGGSELELRSEVLADIPVVETLDGTWTEVREETTWKIPISITREMTKKRLEWRLWCKGSPIEIVQVDLHRERSPVNGREGGERSRRSR